MLVYRLVKFDCSLQRFPDIVSHLHDCDPRHMRRMGDTQKLHGIT